jgi:WD40 repeat protein
MRRVISLLSYRLQSLERCLNRSSAAFCAILVLTLAACGGGGGGTGAAADNPGANAPPAGAPNGTPAAAPVLNPGYSGTIITHGPGVLIEIDIATGVERMVRPRYSSPGVSKDGSEYAVFRDQPGTLSTELLEFIDRDGITRGEFSIDEGFGGRPEISPDGQMVLAEWHSIDLGDAGGVSVPTVFKRDGTIVKRYVDYGSYTWMPDGSILLVRGDSIYRTTPTSTAAPTLLKKMPNAAVPYLLRVSPDGSKIAFAIQITTDGHVWVMNSDGSGMRQVTTSSSNDDPGDFSPDSKHLMVTQGISFAAIGPGYVFAGCPETYIVPLDSTAVINLTADDPAPALKLRGVFDDSGDASSKLCSFAPPRWRALPALAKQAGTPISGGGVNRGLTGTAWFQFSSDVYKTDISSGAISKIVAGGNPFHVSLDGSEFIMLDRFSPTDPSDQELIFYNKAGTRIGSITTIGDYSSSAKLAPNKLTFAAEWHSIDRGDAGGVDVVNIFDRAGNIKQRFVGYSSWEWLPNGTLLMQRNGDIYSVTPNASFTTTPTKIITTPNDNIYSLVASRDGSKLAFIMAGNAWMVNLDGTGLRKVTDSSDILGGVEFSPNGKQLVVYRADSAYQAWFVPADGERVPVMHKGVPNTSAFVLQGAEMGGSLRDVFANSRISWR